MPEIHLVGYGCQTQSMSERVKETIKKKFPKKKPDDVVIARHYGVSVENLDGDSRPYVYVSSTDQSDCENIAQVLSEELEIEVSCGVLLRFFVNGVVPE